MKPENDRRYEAPSFNYSPRGHKLMSGVDALGYCLKCGVSYANSFDVECRPYREPWWLRFMRWVVS